MKTYIIIFVFAFSFASNAQVGERMQEKIKAQKIAFISEKLDLSVKEAQGFWPVYNAYEKEVEGIRSGELKSIKAKLRQDPGMSESEASNLITRLLKAEQSIHNAKVNLVNDLKKVISSVKILKLKAAEEQFNQRLLDKLREFRERRQNRNRKN